MPAGPVLPAATGAAPCNALLLDAPGRYVPAAASHGLRDPMQDPRTLDPSPAGTPARICTTFSPPVPPNRPPG